MASAEPEIKALLDRQSKAMREKDIDQLMSLYSHDVVYFDTVPPLRFVGSDALRVRFLRWFDGFQGPIGIESRDLNVLSSGDIAVAHWLSRASGTLTNGREIGSWVRATSCCQRSGQGWLITHEHVSFPVDIGSGSVATDEQP
jgi:ketosteroid isomerase-like protein